MQMDEQQLLEKIRRLPPEKQQEVVDFVEEAEQQASAKKPRRSLEGALSHLNIHISKEEIDQARHEMWSNFPRNDIG